MACSECLLTRLNPLAKRTCFAQVGPVVGSALSAQDLRLPTQVLPPLSHPPFLALALHWHSPTGVLSQLFFPGVLSRVFFPGCSFPGVPSWVFFPRCSFHSPTGVLSRDSHPQFGSREPSTVPQSTRVLLCALCGTSVAPSVARHLRPLWHVICALCGTS
jgi:hypothetical protein